MRQEIERKFLITHMPNLDGIVPTCYERSFLFLDQNSEIRIQKKWTSYQLERKVTDNSLQSTKHTIRITQSEYESLKKNCKKTIVRTSYLLSKNPHISIKTYNADFSWLSRVEIEFDTQKEASDFSALAWFGKEITNSPLGRDSKLINLSHEDFLGLINS